MPSSDVIAFEIASLTAAFYPDTFSRRVVEIVQLDNNLRFLGLRSDLWTPQNIMFTFSPTSSAQHII